MPGRLEFTGLFATLPTHNHLAQHRMQRLEIENQVQFAHVFKQVVQTFHKNVDQVQQRKRRLC
jgi:hypothetical protein